MPEMDIVERTLLGQGSPTIFYCARYISKHMTVIRAGHLILISSHSRRTLSSCVEGATRDFPAT
jgi:hypothetical protein